MSRGTWGFWADDSKEVRARMTVAEPCAKNASLALRNMRMELTLPEGDVPGQARTRPSRHY